jgi:hypothetical protein
MSTGILICGDWLAEIARYVTQLQFNKTARSRAQNSNHITQKYHDTDAHPALT